MNYHYLLRTIRGDAVFAFTATYLGGCAVENIVPDQANATTAVDFS